MGKKIVVANPHWQGGGKDCCYYGIKEIEELYLQNVEYTEIPAADKNADLIVREKIIGLDIIRKQLKAGAEIIEREAPDRIFTVGGSCDGDISSILYLNKRYGGDMAVVWVDAHGDINSADESWSRLFYGMPIRAMIGDFPNTFGDIVTEPMSYKQFMNVGGRDFDPPEIRYFAEHDMPWVKVENSSAINKRVCDAIRSLGKSHVYVHMDLDVLEPTEFSYFPLPAKNGFYFETVFGILTAIKENFDVPGFGLYEFSG
ncbi:MAG: arginase family protein, partial [Lachnospiraceae bacterium]|nr:arginase family protein [Lachnospiraceae bacterium]